MQQPCEIYSDRTKDDHGYERENLDQLSNLSRNAHAIAKSCRPFSDYVWQATLDDTQASELKICLRMWEFIWSEIRPIAT